VLDLLAEIEFDPNVPHLISVHELRAAGALDVPPAWRKSLCVERDLFSGMLFGDDDMLPDNHSPASNDEDDNGPSDEPSCLSETEELNND
jgi:hypothetical protein